MTITRDMIEQSNNLSYEITEHVREVFDEYCKVFGIHPAYGVEKWEVRWHDGKNTLYIKQDTSARSCYNYEEHYLPEEWLYMEPDERTAAITKAFEEEQNKERIEKARSKKEELARLERRAEQLKQELNIQTENKE